MVDNDSDGDDDADDDDGELLADEVLEVATKDVDGAVVESGSADADDDDVEEDELAPEVFCGDVNVDDEVDDEGTASLVVDVDDDVSVDEAKTEEVVGTDCSVEDEAVAVDEDEVPDVL